MRLRYLHLGGYQPIEDMQVKFASGSPMNRECAIRFVVGVNGSGKSNLLRAIAEVFIALADGRLPSFPVRLVYELGKRGAPDQRTLILDSFTGRTSASLWIGGGYLCPDSATVSQFEDVFECLRINSPTIPPQFKTLVARGKWPSGTVTPTPIALPTTVLAYTTGDPQPWKSIWNRNQDAAGVYSFDDDAYEFSAERPSDWTNADEAAIQPAKRELSDVPDTGAESYLDAPSMGFFRRPILLSPTLLKCALLAVALPHSVKEAPKHKTTLHELFDRGGLHSLVSVGFRSRLQPNSWKPELFKTAHDWLMCASEAIAVPHPTEKHRTIYFDIEEQFSGGDAKTLMAYDGLDMCTTQGDALWLLLGGHEASAFKIFQKLVELHQSGLFDDVELRLLKRQVNPGADTGQDEPDRKIGVLCFEDLSDGERMVLGRMALFHLLAGQQDALLLLDEPETHFNDKWKREIVDHIDGAIRDTANDVLISTHSAIVLSDVFNDEIVMIRKTAAGSEVDEVADKTFATDPSELMIRVFGAEDSIGKRAQEFIEKTLKESSGSPEDVQNLKALMEQMGSGFYRSELRTLLFKLESKGGGRA